jgi:hypothetical protein|tara:strand:+ start:742 stop:2688 length:1947 start_codon:yes stop_codon:yes gene_type:complete
MAIKIPRDTLDKPRVRAGDSAMLSAVQGSKINYDKLTNTIDVIGARIQAHNRRIEEQRIDNTNTTNTSLLKGDINQELENIKNNQDLNTDGDYNLNWNTFTKKLETKYKKLYKGDEDAFARFESIMYATFNDGQIAMWKERRKKVLAEAQINFNNATQEFKDDLDKQDVTSNIWVSTDLLLKQEEERFIKAKTLGLDVNWKLYKSTITDMVWKKVITANHQYTDQLTGKIEIDYLKVYNDLSAAKSTQTWFGKKMDKATKNSLSKWAKTKHDEQDKILGDTHARIDNENSVDINKILNELSVGNYSSIPENVNPKEWLSNKILNGKLTDKTKKAHINLLNKVFPEDKSTDQMGGTHGSPVALNEWFSKIIQGEYINSNTFAQGVNQDERLTAKGKELVLGWAKNYTTERNEYKKELVDIFLSGFDQASSDLPPEIAAFVNSNKAQMTITLNRIIAEGEDAGISIHAMLGDNSPENPYYIGWKLIDIYQQGMLSYIRSKGDKGELLKKLMKNEISSAEYFTAKRDAAYSAFFDVDPEKDGNQLAFLKDEYESNAEGLVTAIKDKQINTDQAIFLQRLLKKPMPPEFSTKGSPGHEVKESIDDYLASEKYKEYNKDLVNWIYEGNFNSDKIPTMLKFFGSTDLPTIKIKN